MGDNLIKWVIGSVTSLLTGRSVGWSGGKLHFHVPIGAYI